MQGLPVWKRGRGRIDGAVTLDGRGRQMRTNGEALTRVSCTGSQVETSVGESSSVIEQLCARGHLLHKAWTRGVGCVIRLPHTRCHPQVATLVLRRQQGSHNRKFHHMRWWLRGS